MGLGMSINCQYCMLLGLGVGPPSGGLGVRPPSGGLDIFKLAVLLYSGYNIVIKLQPTTMLPANQI